MGAWLAHMGDVMIRAGRAVSLAFAAIATLGASAASAADLAARPFTKAPAPVYQAPISWTGCYGGGNVGAGWDRFNAGEVGFAGVPTPFVDYGSNTGSSLIGGGQIGCDYQFASNWLVGIQGKAEFGDIDSSNAVAAFPGITGPVQAEEHGNPHGTPRLYGYASGSCLCEGRCGMGERGRCSDDSREIGGRIRKLQYHGLYGGWRPRMDVRPGMVGVWRI